MSENIVTIDLQNYRNWLCLFSPEEIVGTNMEVSGCPVKNYMFTVDPDVESVDYTYCYKKGYAYVRYTIIPDISGMIRQIDHSGVTGDGITAQQALDILDRLYPNLIKEPQENRVPTHV